MIEDPNSEFPAGDETGCQFPTGIDGQTCEQPIARSGAPGRPPRYCNNPEHTRAKAFAARRALERGGAGHTLAVEVAVPEHPVSDGRASFGALLARFEEAVAQAQRAAADQHNQLTAILERATQTVRTVSDPDAAGYEVEQIQRETSVLVAEAQTAQALAERSARDARKTAQAEIELRAQADEAADEAIRELAAVRADTAETIARITTETDTVVAEHQQRAEAAAASEATARRELDQVRADAERAVAAAHAEAEQHKRDTDAETERILAQHDADMHRQIDQSTAQAAQQVEAAQAEAAAQVKEAQDQLAAVNAARIRAQADQDGAERRAGDDRSALERLRAQYEQQRSDHHDELAELRAEIRQERDEIRRERTTHAEQLAALLTTIQQQTNDHTDTEPGTAQPGRRRPKED